MKIVFIIDSLRRHGAQRFLTHLARGLARLGYVQTVIALNNASDPDIEKELSSAGCSIATIGKRAFLLGGFGWWRLVAILRKRRPDIVMTLLDMADTMGRPAAHLAGCRLLLSSIRVRNIAKPGWQRWLDRKTVGWANKIIFNSGRVVPYALKNEGVNEEQVIVIPNGVDDWGPPAAKLRDPARAEIGVTPQTFVLGAVGRLNPQKNIGLLLQIAARLPKACDWKLVIIGDGPERPKLLRQSRELGVADRVSWMGARPDMAAWYACMDLFVHTADFEGMPNAVMEAMASGLPVVASAVDGTQDLIVDGRNGHLVPAGDVNGFVQRIDQLMSDPELTKQMGESARRDILENFGMEQMIQSYDKLFNALGNA